MKVETYKFPKSSFLSVEKDLSIITQQILKNDNLVKLLHYTSPDAYSRPNLTEEQKIDLFGKNVKIIPKLTVDGSVLNYIIVSFDNFMENGNNPQFRDNVVEFDIICHFDQWQLEDTKLRPYRIAAELDSMFNNNRLTGIGLTHFLGASQIVLNDEFSGLCLMYQVVHGEEDKKNPQNPKDAVDYNFNFDKIFNLPNDR